MQDIKIKTVKVETATQEALAPFGVILGRNEKVKPLPISLYNGTVKVRRLGNFISDETTEIPVCTVQRRPLIAEYMERHHKLVYEFNNVISLFSWYLTGFFYKEQDTMNQL